MSVKLMSMIYGALIGDINYQKGGKSRVAKASTCKIVLLAIADNANDFGESSYPGIRSLERKTELSRQAIVDTIAALESAGYLSIDRRASRIGTNSYSINLVKLKEQAQHHPEPELDDDASGGQATLPVVVKPLYQGGQATLPDSSINHQLTIQGAQNAPRATFKLDPNPKTKKLGDILDGMLSIGSPDSDLALQQRINQYPPHLQAALRYCANELGWSAGMIPPPPSGKGKKGSSAYGLWVKELNELHNILADVSDNADKIVRDAANRARGLNIARPGSLIGFVRPVAGEYLLAKRRAAKLVQQSYEQSPIDTADISALENIRKQFDTRSD